MPNMIINFNEDKIAWDAFAIKSPQRSVFIYTKFLDSLIVKYDLITCHSKGDIVAGVVILYNESGDPMLGTFPFTQYQGLLLADNTRMAAHSQITHEFKVVEYLIEQMTGHYRNLSFCHSWRVLDLRSFQWYNYNEPEKGQFKIDLRYTGILNLSEFKSYELYMASVRQVRRQDFKKASKVLSFRFSNDVLLLDKLHSKTFQRQNIDRPNRDSMLLQSICCRSIADGYGKIGVAYLDEVPCSAVLFLYDDRTAYYLFGANDPAYRKIGSGTFALMKMIEDAFSLGLEEVDFVGANSPQRGDFKISFNAELRPYFETKYHE